VGYLETAVTDLSGLYISINFNLAQDYLSGRVILNFKVLNFPYNNPI
jgi:hypothetical protein